MPKKINCKIPPDFESRRLDVALFDLGIFFSRSQSKRAIEDGMVIFEGEAAKPRFMVKPGHSFEVTIPDLKPAEPQPENIPLEIIFEDEDIIVVDKPPNIVVHPGAGNKTGTLVNALLSHCGDLSGIGGVARPGIVHRLDKETSGVLIVAKNDAAHLDLSSQFHDRKVEKIYLAIIVGKMPQAEGIIESTIGRSPHNRLKMQGKTRDGRAAASVWKVVEEFPWASLISVKPLTGRTHQIRVHLSEFGRPVVGDKIYSNKNALKNVQDTAVRAALLALDRQALHAHKLTIDHPRSKRRMTFESPLPDDMKKTLEGLRRAASRSR